MYYIFIPNHKMNTKLLRKIFLSGIRPPAAFIIHIHMHNHPYVCI